MGTATTLIETLDLKAIRRYFPALNLTVNDHQLLFLGLVTRE